MKVLLVLLLVFSFNLTLQSAQRFGEYKRVKEVSANYTATVKDDLILVDTTSGNVTITLPLANSTNLKDKIIKIKKVDNSTNEVTINRSGADTLNASYTTGKLISEGDVIEFISNGTNKYHTTVIRSGIDFKWEEAGFFGSVRWTGTGGCVWANTTGSLSDFPADADCDNAVRTIRGEYNTTNGDIGNADGQLPQIKFSNMPKGTYKFVARGDFGRGSYYCGMAFYDGTSYSTIMGFSDHTNVAVSHPIIGGEFYYSADQTNKTFLIRAQNHTGGGTYPCRIYADGGNTQSGLEISVYYYPDFKPRLQ